MGKQHGTIMVVRQGECQEPRGEERRDPGADVLTKAAGEEAVLEIELFVATDSQPGEITMVSVNSTDVVERSLVVWVQVQYANFEEAQEEAIPCHSRKGIKRESNMTHA
jgi:hypothetical protein